MLLFRTLAPIYLAAMVMAQRKFDGATSFAAFKGSDMFYPGRTNEDSFKDLRNVATILASIVLREADIAEYHPQGKDACLAHEIYNTFVDRVAKSSYLTELSYKRAVISLSGGLNDFRDKIEQTFDTKVVTSGEATMAFRNLLPSNLDRFSDESEWALSHIAIRNGGRANYALGITHIFLSLTKDLDTGAPVIDAQQAYMEQYLYTINSTLVVERAEVLSKRVPIVTLQEFTEALSTNNRQNRGGLEAWLEEPIQETNKMSVSIKFDNSRQRLYPIAQLRMDA